MNFFAKKNYIAGYAESIIRRGNLLTLRPGVRIEKLGEYRTTVSPRLNFNLRVTDQVQLLAAVGRYYQTVATAREKGVLGFLDLWFPTSPERAEHFILGIEYGSDASFNANLSAYYKPFSNLLKSIGPAPDLVHVDGHAEGLEFQCSKTGQRYAFDLAYTFARTQRSYEGLTYPPPYDIRHNFLANYSLKISRNWTFTTSWRLVTGAPYSAEKHPAIYRGFYLDQTSGEIIISGGNMSYASLNPGDVRYPTNHRLDIGFMKNLGENRWSWAPFFQIYNLYNHKNVVVYKWIGINDIDGTGSTRVQKNVAYSRNYDWIPFLPTVGFRLRL